MPSAKKVRRWDDPDSSESEDENKTQYQSTLKKEEHRITKEGGPLPYLYEYGVKLMNNDNINLDEHFYPDQLKNE